MNVALFTHRYPPALGGAEAYAARLAEYLRSHGDDVTVWTTSAVQLEEFWHGCPHDTCITAEVRRYKPMTFPLRRYALKALSLLTPPRLRAWCLPCNPVCLAMLRDADTYAGPLDGVHALAFPYAWPILCARRLAKRRGVPFHLTPFLHLGDERTKRQYLQPALKWLLCEADRVFVQTQLEYDAVAGAGVPDNRIVLQGLGVDAAECTGGDRVHVRDQWQCGSDVVIGHLANLSFEKGTVDLLQACQRLWHAGKRFRVVLAGPDMASFRAFWTGFEFKENVIRTGVLTDIQKRDFYAGIDIFALPSRCDSFGLVLPEAWANAKPNVAYACGGPGEIIRDGVDGLLAATGDIGALAMQLERLIECESLRWRLGAAGESRIQSEFNWGDKLAMVRDAMHPTYLGLSGRDETWFVHRGLKGRETWALTPAGRASP